MNQDMYPELGTTIGAVVVGYNESNCREVYLNAKPSVLHEALVPFQSSFLPEDFLQIFHTKYFGNTTKRSSQKMRKIGKEQWSLLVLFRRSRTSQGAWCKDN